MLTFFLSGRKFIQPLYDTVNEGDGGGDTAEAIAAAAAAKKIADDAAAAEVARLAAEAAKKDPKIAQLEADNAKLLKETMERKDKIKSLTDTETQLKAQLAKFDGVDLEAVSKLLKDAADKEKSESEKKGDFDRVKAMMAEEHKKELDLAKAALEAEQVKARTLAESVDKLTIGNSFASSKLIAETLVISPTKARSLYGAHFEMKDGVTVAFDKPAGAANRTMLIDGSGEPLGFEAAFKRILDADPDAKSLTKANIAAGGNGGNLPKDTQDKSKVPEVRGAARIVANLKGL